MTTETDAPVHGTSQTTDNDLGAMQSRENKFVTWQQTDQKIVGNQKKNFLLVLISRQRKLVIQNQKRTSQPFLFINWMNAYHCG